MIIQGKDFLSHPQKKNGFFFSCSPFYTAFFILKRFTKISAYAAMQTMTSRAFRSVILPMGRYGICKIKFFQMGKTAKTSIWCARNSLLLLSILLSI